MIERYKGLTIAPVDGRYFAFKDGTMTKYLFKGGDISKDYEHLLAGSAFMYQRVSVIAQYLSSLERTYENLAAKLPEITHLADMHKSLQLMKADCLVTLRVAEIGQLQAAIEHKEAQNNC